MTRPDAVYILGVGLTPVGEHWQTSLRSLALQAIQKAMGEVPSLRPGALYVANMLAPALSGQAHLGSLLSDFAGLRGIEAVTVEAAGASGGLALRQAFLALAAGAHDVVLVVGAEKITDQVGPGLDSALMASGDSDYEGAHGLTPTALAALRMRRYLHESGAPADALSGFSRAAHAHAVANPNALFRKEITGEDYRNAPMISEPVNLYDAAPVADGAAALLLARSRFSAWVWPRRPLPCMSCGTRSSFRRPAFRPNGLMKPPASPRTPSVSSNPMTPSRSTPPWRSKRRASPPEARVGRWLRKAGSHWTDPCR
jgi:acetyl-CoA acetyltransferase